jgi:uncharacterized membrane protein
MAFCPNCGSQVEGKFCAKCGTPIAASPAPPGVTLTPPTPAAPSAAGLETNVASALCYLLGVITGILFLVLEPYNKNKTIRFHAFQSIFAWAACLVLYIVLGIFLRMAFAVAGLWSIFSLFYDLLYLAIFVGWVFLMYKAYNNERFVIPIIGPIAEKQAR